MNETRPRLANLAGIARTFSLPRDWFRQEANAGRIPCIRVGDSYLFNVDAVRTALAVRAAQSEPEARAAGGSEP